MKNDFDQLEELLNLLSFVNQKEVNLVTLSFKNCELHAKKKN